MARLDERPSYYGTYDGICVYRMHGGDFMRSASSLTGERVKTKAEFKNTMAWAQLLKTASRLASAVYAMLPSSRRKHPFYRKLTGHAMKLLKEGRTEGEVVVALMIAIKLPPRKPKKVRTKLITMHFSLQAIIK